jgi:CHAD domain-containing protein
LTPDTHIAEAGRIILARELATIQAHQSALLHDADVVAVHETRKAIRRTFTAVKLFNPFFEPGVLKGHRRQLRKIMRRLAPCRDIAVFLLKLSKYLEEDGRLAELEAYWRGEKNQADERLRRYLSKPERQAFLDRYARFTNTAGLGVLGTPNFVAPVKVRHQASLLIHRRLAAARAYDDHLQAASPELFHQLRIQLKELRYTLGFFAPILGPELEEARAGLKRLQQLLGDLNDARVSLRMLAETRGVKTAASIYHAAKEAEVTRLESEFPATWAEFESIAWRQKLATVLAIL